jgi:hypothetical protein
MYLLFKRFPFQKEILGKCMAKGNSKLPNQKTRPKILPFSIQNEIVLKKARIHETGIFNFLPSSKNIVKNKGNGKTQKNSCRNLINSFGF